MNKYFLVFKQSLKEILEYRFDLFLHLTKYSAMVLMMIFVWTAVQRAGNISIYSMNDTVVYFFLAAILYGLSNFHPFYIEEDIRLGGLSKYLIKPISPLKYYLAYELASVILEMLIRLAILVPILFVFGFKLHVSLLQLSFFISFLPFIFIFTYNFLSIVSLTAFWITEASALRWATLIIVRFLSGMLVPISFFSPFFQQISAFLPFQYLGYVPIQFMLQPTSWQQMSLNLGVLMLWTLVMISIKNWYWHKGLSLYEGVGA